MERRDEMEEDTATSIEIEMDLISRPEQSEKSSINENIISLNHSFGYDCKKMYNLVLMNNETLVFASGNLIHFFDVATSSITTRRSACGGGIGCVAKNPNPVYNHLTIGENGKKPTIFIYKFPDMQLVAMLKKGTKRQFSILDYTSDGELLASQGGDPDYMITIWDWKRQEIKLRAKSFSNDVANLMFSPYIPEQLTTCGLGHIKFWKMSSTFTGLKLQGLIGRFGKTEICDIYGVCPLPDEKVLSGCEWGNVLVWDNGLIKLEVCRKNRRPCHSGPITQIFMRNAEEIMTVGTDGFIRIWFWETVELSDPPEDDRFVEIEPSHEFRVGLHNYNAELLKIIKIDSNDNDWYAQDGLGGIWCCDLSTEIRPQLPRQLFRCHAGEIVAMDTSSVSQHVATLGRDGRLYIYDYVEQQMVFHHQFLAGGGDFIWLPASIDSTGAVMILGFSDGVIRVITFSHKLQGVDQFQLVQVVKCHCKPITKISVNPKGSIFVSASEDSTIFVHHLVKDSQLISLQPIGFINVPSPVTCINWNPTKWATIVVGCQRGDVVQADLPERSNSYTDTSYHLSQVPLNHFKFKSIKSQIRRNQKVKQIELRKEQKRQRKLKEIEKRKKEDPDYEEPSLADSEDEEVLEPIHIPEPANPILWIQFTYNNTLWLSLGGFDAGYIYEFNSDNGEIISYTLIAEADDIEIHSYIYMDNYLILGMADGKIRINRVDKDNWWDLSDFWLLSMHDNFFGKIPRLKFSWDNKLLFSVGADGNLFSYNWNLPLEAAKAIKAVTVPRLIKTIFDIDDVNFLSLEQQKEKENDEKRQKISTDNKNKVLTMIEDLRMEFDEIMKTNLYLPESQKLTAKDLELDDRISDDLQQKLDILMDVVRRRKEFDYERVKLAGRKLMEHFINPVDFPIQVVGINNQKTVYSFRIKSLGDDFYHLKNEMDLKIKQAAQKTRHVDTMDASVRTLETESSAPIVESFLIGLSPIVIETKLESKMRRLLNKYRERKSKEVARKKEWQFVNAERPNPDMDHPTDKKLIEDAKQTIGNYKLKTEKYFEPSDDERETIVKKLEELLRTREDVYNIRNEYNQRIFAMRDKKKNLIDFIRRKLRKLDEIHQEIPESSRVNPKVIVTFSFDREFPERNLDLKKYLSPETYDMTLLMTAGESRMETRTPRDIVGKQLMNIQREVLQDIPMSSVDLKVSHDFCTKELKRIATIDENATDWEDELKNLRTRRRLFEQQQIIRKINLRIGEFDDEIESLCDERYDVEVKAKFKELYLLTLNHELMILKDFEAAENRLSDVVESKDAERKHLSCRITQTNTDIETLQKAIDELHDAKRKVEHKFNANCLENKFAPYLKKIFKKKLYLDDEKSANDEDMEKEKSESDESSVNNSTTGSSIELGGGMKNLNEDQCPKHCDRKLYDLTFELRQERYEVEQMIKLKERDKETFLSDLEVMIQRQDTTEGDYSTNRGQLTELRQKKQNMLNEVNTCVCLKMDQMQYFKNQLEFELIGNTLLFNNHNVTRLYSRVGKLALETIEAKRKHRINVIHLAKMKTDIKFMEKQITDLKDGTSQAMLKKFGREIDLNEVEETILRRFAFEMQVEMRANAEDIKRQYFYKINELKKSKISKEEYLSRVIQDATEKLNILTVLEEERNFLHRIISMQGRKKESRSGYFENNNDLSKLKEISNHQKDQIEMLQREIRALSLKTKSFVDARQDFESLNYSITQLRGECRFEDSICSNPDESMLSSTRATTPDNEVFNDILKSVKKFAETNLSEQLEDVEIENVSLNLAKYLTNVAVNFPSTEAEEILPEVINNFSNFLPKHLRIAPEKIAKLVALVIGNYNDASDVNRCEVLKEIMNNTIESANHTAISSSSYLQHILTEIFKQMVITMRFNDICSPDCATEIITRLAKLKIQTKSVSIDETVDVILEHAIENMEDDIDGDILKRVIGSIISKLNV